jgi:hypothetical protein
MSQSGTSRFSEFRPWDAKLNGMLGLHASTALHEREGGQTSKNSEEKSLPVEKQENDAGKKRTMTDLVVLGPIMQSSKCPPMACSQAPKGSECCCCSRCGVSGCDLKVLDCGCCLHTVRKMRIGYLELFMLDCH